jgi:transposase
MQLSKRSDSTRDQRRDVHALRRAGNTHRQISEATGLSINQVQYALSKPPTPSKRSGRPRKLTEAQVEELIEFVTASKYGRRLAWRKIPLALGWEDVGYYAIRSTLRSNGFKRYAAWRKPPISEVNRIKRLNWALEHENWTLDQWACILWSDESWVSPGRHTRTWVTRRQGEELDPTCIIERHQRKKGWMFWGCFSGCWLKGPCLVWEKEWGSINKETYCERIVPLIDGWIRLHPEHQFMQDNAPAHSADMTLTEMKERGIQIIEWPAYSPDLNPIEHVWNRMKDWIQEHYEEEDMSYGG